jgi:transcriptional regulator with XRE-family HTH domain
MFLSKNIKYLRKSKQMTLRDLADALEFKTHTTVSKYEADEVNPPLESIQKIAELFGVSMQELMFVDLAAGQSLGSVSEDSATKDRMIARLDRELTRLETLEARIKNNPRALEKLGEVDPELVKILKG